MMYHSSRWFAVPVAAVSAPLLFGAMPPALPGLVIVAVLLGEGMAVLTSREASKRFVMGLVALDADEVASVYGPVSADDVASLHARMFGTCEEVSVRAVSTDYCSVLGLQVQHVIRVDAGCRGATRLDDMTTKVDLRLTSAGWRIEGFSPLEKGR